MSAQYVPGRPVTGPGGKCPFCRQNGMLKGEVIVSTAHGYAVQIADDLVLICPTDHLVGEPWDTPFADEYFSLLRLALGHLKWPAYNESRNIGHIAGQRLEHIHYKLQRRDDGQPASGWGLDGLINLINAQQQ